MLSSEEGEEESVIGAGGEKRRLRRRSEGLVVDGFAFRGTVVNDLPNGCTEKWNDLEYRYDILSGVES
ncbi:hypothetical protein AVEN_71522-1 [Araneus ventricosus]|uniref:Uncharacterized protein n=1 Tax=Araneus ventricosus TaxID=182803 RepID=A0A4Y2QES7_ARAVE|nr:hypothetical protein AVEN_71522-1 [Araneus ventricosus]